MSGTAHPDKDSATNPRQRKRNITMDRTSPGVQQLSVTQDKDVSFCRSPQPDGTADHRKVRTAAACRNCTVKKIKCIGGRSTQTDSVLMPRHREPCQQCTIAGMECAYPSTRDRAAYSRHFIQNFDARLQALEQVYQQIMAILTGGAIPDIRTPVHHDTRITDSTATREWSMKSKGFDLAIPEEQVFPVGDAESGESGKDVCNAGNSDNHQKMETEVHSCLRTGLLNILPIHDNFPQPPDFGHLVNDDFQSDETTSSSTAVDEVMSGHDEGPFPDRKLGEEMVDVFFSAIQRKRGRGMATASKIPKTTGKRKRLGNVRDPVQQFSADRSSTSHCSGRFSSISPRTVSDAIENSVKIQKACVFTTDYEASDPSGFLQDDCPIASKYPILSGLPMESVYNLPRPSRDLALGTVAPTDLHVGGGKGLNGLETLLDSWTEGVTAWTDDAEEGALSSFAEQEEQWLNTKP